MSNRKTERINEEKGQFRKSVGAGIAAVASGGRTYYMLEFKTGSSRYPAGTTKEIITNYIELGRDPKCVIRFGEDVPTVSRRHAAISKEGPQWYITNLSSTNPTILNGKPVNKRYYLNTGDEIQLSMEGPKLGFIVPANNKTGTLGLSKRLSLFREQALMPYKKAIVALSIFLFLAIAGGAWMIFKMLDANNQLRITQEEIKAAYEQQNALDSLRMDSLRRENEQNASAQRQLGRMLRELERQLEERPAITPVELPPPAAGNPGPSGERGQAGTTDEQVGQELEQFNGDVYFVRFLIEKLLAPDGREEALEFEATGTGFLLDDGRFVTARHVVEPWSYLNGENEGMAMLNVLVNNGGRVVGRIEAISPSGNRLRFQLSDFQVDRSTDIAQEIDSDGNRFIIKLAQYNKDYAYVQTQERGRLQAAPAIASNPQSNSELWVLGYPYGIGASEANNMSPILSNTKVARSGLEQGLIITTDRNFDHGNSGGPVLYRTNGTYKVVGIISSGVGDAIGQIVPISAIY